MSSVSAAGTPVHLGLGDSHKRTVTLRDANGTPVPDSADLIVPAETKASPAGSVPRCHREVRQPG